MKRYTYTPTGDRALIMDGATGEQIGRVVLSNAPSFCELLNDLSGKGPNRNAGAAATPWPCDYIAARFDPDPCPARGADGASSDRDGRALRRPH